MATSGSANFQMNSRDVVTAALRKLQVIDANEALPDDLAQEGLQALNMMLKTWGSSGRLWLTSEATVTLLASTITYALTGVRDVLSVRRRTSSIDITLEPLSRQEYYDIPNKSQAGVPINWYLDRQRATKTLYIWPAPSTAVAAATTLPYTYARYIEDSDALDNDPDVPQEWFEALVYGLARRLGPNHEIPGVTPALWAEVKEASERLYAALTTVDQETTSTFFQPA